MVCPAELYIATDVDVVITIESGFTLADIVDLEVTLTERADGSNFVVYTLGGGGVDITGSVITLLILQTDILVAGKYAIKIRMTDTIGKLRGITPCPDELTFKP